MKVSAVGVCGTDLHFYRGSFPSPVGLLPGHEMGGVIDALGEGLQLPVGAAVAVEPQSFCGECYQCRTGNHNRLREAHPLRGNRPRRMSRGARLYPRTPRICCPTMLGVLTGAVRSQPGIFRPKK
jgi:threonine dehydrogenase-like Zn-dependent dehydrogenase